MDPLEEYYLEITRRRFFGRVARSLGAGLGTLALGSLCAERASATAASAPARLPSGPQLKPRAKRVIYFHMEGAPSQIDLFDYKPGLRERYDQDLPDSIRQGQR